MKLDQRSAAELVDLSGRTALVTGGATGIGLAIVKRLAHAGAYVVIADDDPELAALAEKGMRSQDLPVRAVHSDVSDEPSVASMVAQTVRRYGSVDILVNNAGIYPSTPVLEMTGADFDRVVATNLRGAFLCSQAAARQMIAQGHGGRIVNVTSIDALRPSAVGLAHYDASKSGLWGFTKNLALELAPYGVWVNALAPGGVNPTGVRRMHEASPLVGNDSRPVSTDDLDRIPMRRLADADEVARVALFLCSDLCSYMTGTQVVVDGGMLLT